MARLDKCGGGGRAAARVDVARCGAAEALEDGGGVARLYQCGGGGRAAARVDAASGFVAACEPGAAVGAKLRPWPSRVRRAPRPHLMAAWGREGCSPRHRAPLLRTPLTPRAHPAERASAPARIGLRPPPVTRDPPQQRPRCSAFHTAAGRAASVERVGRGSDGAARGRRGRGATAARRLLLALGASGRGDSCGGCGGGD